MSNSKLQDKLKELPSSPGVYFYKSKSGEIIYIGKAAILRNRVRQYFHKSRIRDPKTDALVSEIHDLDWIVVDSEIDALFLESEMIKRYKPRYNIDLRDDKSQTFIRLDMKSAYPHLSFTRQPLDDNAEYYGPYYNAAVIKKALRYLRKIFPYSTHATMPKRVCLQYHIGLCPGVEEQKITSKEYKNTLKKLVLYLKGERKQLISQLEREMNLAAKNHQFEEAAKYRNQISNLKSLQKQIIFSDREFMDISKDQALSGLKSLLTLKSVPHRIEGYDISHMQGSNNTASMVVATNGIADKSEYRKFKMQLPGNNDFAHMEEVITRRFSSRNLDWAKPDLILIDGGKGQLSAAAKALEEKDIAIPMIGLAKRLEEIIIIKEKSNVKIDISEYPKAHIKENQDYQVVSLPQNSHIIKLLQRIRDESHRFAVSYHSSLKRKSQTSSELEDIPGIGPSTRKKLIQSFGSLKAVKSAKKEQIIAVIGLSKADVIWQYIK